MHNLGIPVPDFTRDAGEAVAFEGVVFGRKFHHTRGQDIVIYPADDDGDEDYGVGVDFFTKYITSHKEYRVHVFCDQIIWAQKKVWSEEQFTESIKAIEEEVDRTMSPGEVAHALWEADFIRNYGHGWKFVHFNNLGNVPPNVKSVSLDAISALGLCFGAVDIISLDEKDEHGKRKACVLEINSAPALEGGSLDAYVTAFSRILVGGNAE
jgi:hypothetical protein